ncbi:hypothetical protein N824_16980 [Pedobacter sp. V48]|nr:hypothetical protein N824_16980 [Pedobacter sp. V48]
MKLPSLTENKKPEVLATQLANAWITKSTKLAIQSTLTSEPVIEL